MNISEFVNKITTSASMYPFGTFTSGEKVYTCVNPYSYHMVRQNFDLYNKFDGLFVDGMTMCMWLRFLWKKEIPRLSFDMSGMAVDLFAKLNDISPDESIYFIGAKQEEIEGSIYQIKESYPNIKILGYRNGYFKDAEERKNTLINIVHANPSFVIIGMGSPLQEQFAVDLKNAGYKGIAFTCGGFLHQTSTNIHYYPKWVNKYNLRAFYRLFHEKGMFRRLYNVLLQFPILFIYDTIHSKLVKHNC